MRAVLACLLLFAVPATPACEEDGLELSIQYCARCHVIGEYNRLGGIGNTPSFPWMQKLSDYEERVRTFFARRPHPTFARVEGYPRWSEATGYIDEFTIEVEEIEKILCYVKSLPDPEKVGDVQ